MKPKFKNIETIINHGVENYSRYYESYLNTYINQAFDALNNLTIDMSGVAGVVVNDLEERYKFKATNKDYLKIRQYIIFKNDSEIKKLFNQFKHMIYDRNEKYYKTEDIKPYFNLKVKI